MRKKPWRAGWLGKLLGIHSWSEHMFGNCWCQTNLVEICFECLMHTPNIRKIALLVESDDCTCCENKHFGRKE